jgi:hypothetical protein
VRLAALLLAAASFVSGCGLKAPDVPLRKGPVALNGRAVSAEQEGLPSMCGRGEGHCGALVLSLKKKNDDDQWAYWKAGSDQLIDLPDSSFVRSGAWDMRVTKFFPLVGSNGGATGNDEGLAGGHGAFAVLADPPGSLIPRRADETRAIQFVDDRYEGLWYGGKQLAPEYQNPIVNTIGSGLLKSYNGNTHAVELSYRIFILRTADGADFYTIRFRSYSRANKTIVIDWRKLQ